MIQRASRLPGNLESAPMRLLISIGCDGLRTRFTGDQPVLDDRDWEDLAELARRHGMTAWLYESLAKRTDAPEPVRQRLADEARRQAADALRAMTELVEISRALTRAGVAHVTIKGPALAAWLYSSAAKRAFTDLDVIVRPDQLEPALATLETRGYSLPPEATATAARVVYAGRSAWPLARRGAFPVDLHWRLADLSFSVPLSVTRVIRDAVWIDVSDERLPVPSPTHAAAITFAHAAKHGWCSLEIILTLGQLVCRTDIDWRQVRRSFEDSGTSRGLITGARLAHAVFGLTLPPELDGYHPSQTIDRLMLFAEDLLARPAGDHADRWEERRLHRASLDRRRDRVRYETLRLLMPTPLDAEWCRLPPGLAPLYGPLRLVRLAFQTMGTAFARPSIRG
jgi:Uncharacterised nucleotidyltransferase